VIKSWKKEHASGLSGLLFVAVFSCLCS